ncbi:hypothetical protein [Brevundimonas sp.]|jgi:hypothetical protein|uniref:hypothetical protein n=1 Tax=unclassified Brevundimonas TaxID=2622653 RepID=UPI0035616F79
MATEHEVRRTDGTVERTTTNGTAVETRRGSGMGPIVALIIGLLAVLVIGYFLMNMSNNEAVESNAIAGAAESVGNAADNVGDAAGSAVPSSDR